jgi:hypothetical protein
MRVFLIASFVSLDNLLARNTRRTISLSEFSYSVLASEESGKSIPARAAIFLGRTSQIPVWSAPLKSDGRDLFCSFVAATSFDCTTLDSTSSIVLLSSSSFERIESVPLPGFWFDMIRVSSWSTPFNTPRISRNAFAVSVLPLRGFTFLSTSFEISSITLMISGSPPR